MATVTVGVKRAAIVNGKRGTPTTHLSSLSAVPLQPVSPEVAQRFQLQTPYKSLQTYIVGHYDIVTGDFLTVGAVTYVIRGVAAWTPSSAAIGLFMHLIVEDVQA